MIRAVCSFAGWSLAVAIALSMLAPDTIAKEPNPIVKLAKKLDRPVDFPGIDDPKTTFLNALDDLSKRYDVRFFINERAFRLEGGMGAAAAKAPRQGRTDIHWTVAETEPASAKKQGAKEKQASPAKKVPAPPAADEDPKDVSTWLVAKKPIPKMSHVRLATVLKTILARINTQGEIQQTPFLSATETNATYVIRRDSIEITTLTFKMYEFYRHRVAQDHTPPGINDDAAVPEGLNASFRFFPLVQAEFDKRPLEEAFKELADATESSVILDPRVSERAKPVTATLINLPLDTAVEMLANMSGLSVLLRDRGLYVTTKANVDAMQKELVERIRPETPAPTPGQPFAPQAANNASTELTKTQADVARLQVEIAKLKEELAQLQAKRSDLNKGK